MPITRDIANLGIGFFLLYTSVNSAAYIIAVLFRQLGYNDLGLYVTLTNSFFCILGGITAPYFSHKYNSKSLMLISLCCYATKLTTYIFICYFHSVYFVYPLVLVAAAVSGFTACFLWMSQGEYVHQRCEEEGRQGEKGYFFGLFYRLYSGANVSAGVITTFCLGLFEPVVYFGVLVAVAWVAILYIAVFVPKVQLKGVEIKENILVAGQIQTEEEMKAQILSKTRQIKKFSVTQIFRFYPKISELLPMIGLVGFVMGFYGSSLGDLIKLTVPSTDTKIINMRIGIGFILLGLGQVIGSIISGRQADKIHIQTIGAISITLYLLTCQSTVIQYQYLNTIFIYFVSFFWGFIHSYVENWIIVVCSRNFKGRAESFVINKQFHFVTLCVYQVVVIYGTRDFGVLLYLMSFLAVPCIVALTMLRTEEQQRLEE